jgi:aldehyde dehydrogenase (NAD+)
MGGKNAAVVLADADLDLAAATIAAAAFGQAGQRCTATSRVIVDAAVAGEVVARLVARARALLLGPGLDPATTLGPLVSFAQRDDVLMHVARAREDGAVVRCGGAAPAGAAYGHGCFVEPTVLTGVTREMAIWSDEVFGPVVAVQVVDGLDAAIAAANDSAYGLSAAVFTESLTSATRFMDEVDAGQIAVNLPTSGWDVHQPFGGFRDSGSPFKEQGLEALRFYTRAKTCAVRAG